MSRLSEIVWRVAIEVNRSSSPGNSNTSMGVGCLILFALPFAGAGLLALFQGIQRLRTGPAKDAWILCVVGTVFTLVGFGMIIGSLYGLRFARERESRKRQFPQEPWRWREDWAQGRADAQGRTQTIVLWVFTIIWNLISSSVLFALPRELAKGNKAILVALIFPVIGACLLAGVLYHTFQRRKYGRPIFKLLTTPCPVGGQVAGMIEIPVKVKAAGGFQVRLQCIERLTTGTGKQRSTSETPLWQDHATVTQDLLAHQPDRTGIPVRFLIPASAPEASWDACNPSIHWRLSVAADVPGVDLGETFELPVFRTAESPAPTGEPLETAPRWDKPVEQYQPPPGTRIRVQGLPTGGSIIDFPAARNLAAIFTVLLISAFFGGMLYLMILKKAPLIFPVAFGLVELLLSFSLLHMLAHSSRVEADARGVRVKESWVLFRRGDSFSVAEISDVVTARGMQAGNKYYYDVKLRLRAGREITLGSSVADVEHAAWLAAVIRQAVGFKTAA